MTIPDPILFRVEKCRKCSQQQYIVLIYEAKSNYYNIVTITLKNVRNSAEKVFVHMFSFVIAVESVTI